MAEKGKTGTKTVAASRARDEFADLINRVAYSRERVVIERSRKPVAALVSLEDLEILDAASPAGGVSMGGVSPDGVSPDERS